jgi:hypothetical protein
MADGGAGQRHLGRERHVCARFPSGQRGAAAAAVVPAHGLVRQRHHQPLCRCVPSLCVRASSCCEREPCLTLPGSEIACPALSLDANATWPATAGGLSAVGVCAPSFVQSSPLRACLANGTWSAAIQSPCMRTLMPRCWSWCPHTRIEAPLTRIEAPAHALNPNCLVGRAQRSCAQRWT